MTEIEYRLMWTRTYLKKYGLIENSERGIWSLTPKGSSFEHVDEKDVIRVVRLLMKKEKDSSKGLDLDTQKMIEWQEELLQKVQKYETVRRVA